MTDWTPVQALWPDAVLVQPETAQSAVQWLTVLRIPRLLERMGHRDSVLRPLGTVWDMQDRLEDLAVELNVGGPTPAFVLAAGLEGPKAWALAEAYMRLGYLPPLWVVRQLKEPIPAPVRTALWVLAGARETTRWVVDEVALPERRRISELKQQVTTGLEQATKEQ